MRKLDYIGKFGQIVCLFRHNKSINICMVCKQFSDPRPTPLGVLRMNKRTKSSQQLTSSDPVETRQVAPMHPKMEPDNNAALDT